MTYIYKFIWALGWMFFGIVVAYANGIEGSTMGLFGIGFLALGDGLKFIVRKILGHIFE